MKLKIGDEVQIIAGKDKGKKGKITKILRNSNKIVVEKINLVTKHVKKTAQKPGERIKFEAPIDASNTMIICPKCKKTTRIMIKMLKGDKREKQRICKKCKDSLDTIKSKSKK
jgi:large subunit ribosomal protein L24